MNITLERISEREVSLQWSNPQRLLTTIEALPGRMYSNESGERVGSIADYRCVIEHPTFFKPTYRLTCGDQSGIVSERVLPLKGANNFRDAGGYETEDGLMVRWGKLYRSDHLHRLTDNDFTYLEPLGIRYIVDYRNPKEAAKQPNRLWADDIESFFFTPDASSAELAAKASNDAEKIEFLLDLAKSGDSQLAIDNSGKIMEDQYRDFIHHPDSVDAFRQMLLQLAQTGEWAADQHCRGGKDRTGFGIALIHLLLGVKKEFIYHDYMLTNILRAERNSRRMAQYREQTSDLNVLGFLSSMMETRRSYLDASLDEIAQRYGNEERYIRKGLGIEQKTIDTLRALFLTTKSGGTI